jgi:hypothetical protein
MYSSSLAARVPPSSNSSSEVRLGLALLLGQCCPLLGLLHHQHVVVVVLQHLQSRQQQMQQQGQGLLRQQNLSQRQQSRGSRHLLHRQQQQQPLGLSKQRSRQQQGLPHQLRVPLTWLQHCKQLCSRCSPRPTVQQGRQRPPLRPARPQHRHSRLSVCRNHIHCQPVRCRTPPHQ